MAAKPTHVSLIFARAVRVRREQISGENIAEGEPIMTVVQKGDERRLQYQPAQDLIVAETAYDAKDPRNRLRIEEIHAEVKAEKAALAAQSKPQLQKAA